ncbi:MAG: class I SAM-dependent methyltransferase [Candidatus Micrarchaeia archaeon]
MNKASTTNDESLNIGNAHIMHGMHAHGYAGPEFEKSAKELEKNIGDNLAIVDYGCGPGRYCGILERHAKTLYCIDINKESLAEVKKKFARAVILEDISSIPDASIDFLLLANSFHDFADKDAAIQGIARIMKNDGKVAVVDWEKKETNFGPPISIRMSKEDYKEYFKDFAFDNEFAAGENHYGLLFRKT